MERVEQNRKLRAAETELHRLTGLRSFVPEIIYIIDMALRWHGAPVLVLAPHGPDGLRLAAMAGWVLLRPSIARCAETRNTP